MSFNWKTTLPGVVAVRTIIQSLKNVSSATRHGYDLGWKTKIC